MFVVCVEVFLFCHTCKPWRNKQTKCCRYYRAHGYNSKLNWKYIIMKSESTCGYDKKWKKVLKMHRTLCILSNLIPWTTGGCSNSQNDLHTERLTYTSGHEKSCISNHRRALLTEISKITEYVMYKKMIS